LATLGLAWGGLLIAHKSTPLVVPRAGALRAALSDYTTARMLRTVRWNRVEVTPLDKRYEMLGFYRGGRIVATVTVGYAGRPVVHDGSDLARERYEYGSVVANDTRLLALLSAVFVLVTAAWPLWRIRNLDVLALATFTLSVAFYNRGLLERMSMVTYPALLYLAIRCAWWALGPRRSGAPSVALYDHLTRRWSSAERIRVLHFVTLAAGLVVTIVGLAAYQVIDVGYAVTEGATLILHGVLPYGHIPDVLHGDTYPIGSYLLYIPFAWLSPVHNAWDDATLTLFVAVGAALLVAGGLWWMAGPRGGGHGGGTARARATIAWLTFPPLLVTVTTGTTDVALAALLVGTLILWRRAGWGGGALSGAAWFKLVPVAVMPLMLARLRGRALARAAVAIAFTSAIAVALLVILGGPGAPERMWTAISFQFTRGSQHSLWAVTGSVQIQQLAEAATVALIVGAVLRIRRDQALAEDRARIAAVAAAVLLGLQISANYWNYAYLVWVFPFLSLSLLAGHRETRRGLSRGA
jgi:hypothetical protein